MSSSELFIFSNTGQYLPEVEEWLSSEPNHLYAIARTWFKEFRGCGEDVTELLHDGCPTACINGAAFGYVNVFKQHVNIGFYTGAFLDDPENLLEGGGKKMRHVKVWPDGDINKKALSDLIHCAYDDVRNRLALGK
ncbi:MAG: DUF1801 domain-containing protein [Pseudomonadales bacterium]|nr:DUF1801 domain-containing protein [Pseudomonadales bacterium]